MKAEELLKPRYKVVADYPENRFKVGQVIEPFQNWSQNYIEKFPHIFRKMNWWDGRTEEQMPKRLKSLIDGQEYDITGWDLDNLSPIGWVDKEKRSCCDLGCFNPEFGYIPVDVLPPKEAEQ